ncbi:MAG: phosphotriesterase [Lacrimispora sp.]|jgi:phosphotriesterase-related protein|nr:phosphotriesterase [Lacrimispora sp.]
MIYTARGAIHKGELGVTLGHEHIKWETDEFWANSMYFDKKYQVENIETDMKHIIPIMLDIKARGGKSIVETSPPIGGQNVRLLKVLSEQTDMHIIPCTGWNMTKQLYEVFPDHFEEQLANRWIKDFKEGLGCIDGIVIRPGHIKLLLDKGALSSVDKAMLIAAVRASKETSLPIHCHILEAEMVHEVIQVLNGVNADYNKFLWAHADRDANRETVELAAKKGMWIGIDNIRKGTSAQKFELLSYIISLNYGHKVLLSQDYDFYSEGKESMDHHPCTSIFDEFIPYCVANGMNRQEIIRIMTENPANFYDVDAI